MHRRRGFTLLELAIVAVLITLVVIGVLIPVLSAARRPARAMKAGTELTAISKNLVLWSDQFYQQSQDFPKAGLTPPPPNYVIASNSPTDRMGALCNMGSDPLATKLLINPRGTDVPAQGTPPSIGLRSHNLSYAFLDAENPEWKNKVNSSAPVLADKQVGKGTFWNNKYWEGDVAWGDSHVSWETGQTGASWPTTTIDGHTTAHDDLFAGSTGPVATDAVLFNP